MEPKHKRLPEFTIKHNVWRSEHISFDESVENIMEYYKLKNSFKENIGEVIKENAAWNGRRYVLYHKRDIAKIHWKNDDDR